MKNIDKQRLFEKLALRRELNAMTRAAGSVSMNVIPYTYKATKAGVGIPLYLASKATKNIIKGFGKETKHILAKGEVSPMLDGIIAGTITSKAYRSYKDPQGYLGKLRMKYLRSRYLNGGLLNTMEKSYNRAGDFVDYIKGKPVYSGRF